MNHRKSLVISALVGISGFVVLSGSDANAAELKAKPNIILLFADDISARELPVYGSSVWTDPHSKDTSDMAYRAKTPVLDKLAEEGCWVKTMWAATVCSPSRAMMMTGRYAHLTKWWSNGDIGDVVLPDGKRRQWILYESSPMLIGHVARKAGYGTYWAGKTQMPGDLRKYGFDEGCFTPGNYQDTDNPFTDFKMYQKKVDGKKLLFNSDTDKEINTYLQFGWYWKPNVRLMNEPGADKPFTWWPNTPESIQSFGLNSYGPDVELDHIFKFMEREVAAKKPFFIYHTSHLGHDAFDWFYPESGNKWPGTPIVKWDGKSYTRTQPNVTGDKGVYDAHGTITGPGIHNHVNYLDYQVWLYRNKMKELGIEDNTVFIFCADNGTSGYGKISPDRQKGTHVPLIIYAPGMTKHGEQDVLVSLADFLPTIADLTGAKIPADYEVSGESLVPFLFTDKTRHREWLYSYRFGEQLIRGTKVMKDGRGKWWDVSADPKDLISFPQITDWTKVMETQMEERKRLERLLPQYNLYKTEHDAPGTPPAASPPNGKKGKKNNQ